jgi:hypothetical protein
MRKLLFASAAAAAVLSAPVEARDKVQSGNAGGLTWEAQSRIVGMTPTGDAPSPALVGGGNPLFFPSANKSGVVALIMEYNGIGAFICSGSLMSDRMSILTAAHCVSDGFGTAGPDRTTAYFFDGNPNNRTPFGAGIKAIEISNIAVNSGYTGAVIDHNDIAVLRLKTGAFGMDTYELSAENNLRGDNFNVAGYGGRSTFGGDGPNGGANARTGYLREGDNKYDYRLGDPQFNGAFGGPGLFTGNYQFSYVSDFDSGRANNDMSCLVAQATNILGAGGAVFCDTGRGAREVGVAGGDSGGPQFDALGKITSVTSYGLTFGVAFGDCRQGLQSSCGEMNGFVPVYIHRDFIADAMAVPEPGTWALMIAGFGLAGVAVRRREKRQVRFA